jgi:uncharacterized membrane protein
MSDAPLKSVPRLESVDLLRGLVMVVMVLDHVRDFFGNVNDVPENLTTTTPLLFFTRWVTHFCAPTFVFLAGTGAYLAGTRGMSRGELSRFLFVRGLWLALLEVTLVRIGLTFDLEFQFFPLTVLWAIGWSMVCLSGLVFLPTSLVALFGVVMIASHNAFDGVQPAGRFGDIWRLMHVQGMLRTTILGRPIFALYPLVPWIGVMAAGYGFGAIVMNPRTEVRRRIFLGLGLGMTALFVVLRWSNVYGDLRPWSVQERGPVYTALSFLNCSKYPPSLLYLLMTLGPAITLMAVFDRGIGPIGKPLATLGRVPLFYYLLQWPLIHLLAVGYNAAVGGSFRWLLASGPFAAPKGYGHSLAVVYAMWVVTVLLLYGPCRWFAGLKRRRKDAWLSYF